MRAAASPPADLQMATNWDSACSISYLSAGSCDFRPQGFGRASLSAAVISAALRPCTGITCSAAKLGPGRR